MTFRLSRRLRSARGALCSIAATSVAIAACSDATAPLPSDGIPRELSYTSKGFVRITYDVRLARDTVVLTARSYDRNGPTVTVTRRVPTSDEWRAFWRAAADAGVRRWPATCEDTSVLDGGGFTFALAWADGRRSGDYFNSFPTRGGACRGSTSEATTFVNAVHALAGVTYPSFAP